MTNHQYFAQLNNDNVVIHVSTVHRDFLEANPERYPGTWVETFVDVAGKTYAAVGFVYDFDTKNFIKPPYVPYVPPLG